MMDKPNHAAVIGFGSGLSTHTLLGDPRLKSVSTIEIEQAMVDGARAFGPRVARAFTDPRSHIVIDDAKAYFASQNKQFDLIVSEPSNPWISGVGALFSKEFYRFVPKHLSEHGLFVQWIQLYEIDDELLGSILQALIPAFADYSAWISNRNDLIIVASPKGKVPRIDFERLRSADALKQELTRLGVSSTENLEFRQIVAWGRCCLCEPPRQFRLFAHTRPECTQDAFSVFYRVSTFFTSLPQWQFIGCYGDTATVSGSFRTATGEQFFG
jgi:hypothetical protein